MVFVFLGIALFTTFLYGHGLAGGYLFDDYNALENLSYLPEHFSLEAWLYFLGSGSSSPLGRPLALLSFAMQHGSWPISPVDFKRVNLWIHLVNGLLLALLVQKVGVVRGLERRKVRVVASGVMLVWLIHPMHISGVLHVVQRMNLLAATFVFAGIWLYLHGRMKAVSGSSLEAILFSLAGVVGCGTLALLCKENGALLPLLLLVMESTLLSGLAPPFWFRPWRIWFLVVPNGLLLFYFCGNASLWADGYLARPFTMGERLLTQLRVVGFYLRQTFWPDWMVLGLDPFEFPLSRGLLEPVTTLVALVFFVTLVVGTWWGRKPWPVVSFGILWFICGHLLESTFLPLEIYVEHRNYLPLAGLLVVPVVLWVEGVDQTWHHLGRWGMVFLGGAVVAFLSLITYEETRIWGQPTLQSRLWAERNPESLRVQHRLAYDEYRKGRVEKAVEILDAVGLRRSRDINPWLMKVVMVCSRYDTNFSFDQALYFRAKEWENSNVVTTLSILREMVDLKERGRCGGVPVSGLLRLTLNFLDNSHMSARETRWGLQRLAAHLYALEGDVGRAVAFMDRASLFRESVNMRLYQALWWMNAGRFSHAERSLAAARVLGGRSWLKRGVESRRMDTMHRLLVSRRGGGSP